MARDDHIALTRDGYDRTAAGYAERFHHHLDEKPLDLAMLTAFAALVAAHRTTASSTSAAEPGRLPQSSAARACNHSESTCLPT